MRRTVASVCGASPLALSLDLAGPVLAQELPMAQDRAAAWGDDSPERNRQGPERFVITRGLAVVPVRGLLSYNNAMLERWLGWSTYQGLEDSLDQLAANAEVAAIVLDLDTPGGFVTGLEAAAAAVARAAAVKPVHALVNPMAASAGYWLASQAREITMAPGAVVGSIGVALLAAAPVQPDRDGQQWRVMTSHHARAKRPDPESDAGRAELQRGLDEAEAQFHAAVAAGRNIPADQLQARLSVSADLRDGGASFGAAAATARGLADRAESRAAFYARLFGAYAPKPRPGALRGHAAQAEAALAAAAL